MLYRMYNLSKMEGYRMEQNYKLLIVDDEQSILDMLKLQLEFENYTVYTAANAKDALENLSHSRHVNIK